MKINLSIKRSVINSLFGMLCCFVFAACNKEVLPDNDFFCKNLNTRGVYMQDFTPIGNESVGTEVMLTDRRDGIVYRCIKAADGRWWIGENFKYNLTGSVVYNNDAANLETYGRLYKWQEAMDAVPENWDMPSDDEWKVLEMALGMAKEDADVTTSWRNSGNVGTQLKANGDSGMDLLMGGYQHINGTYFNLGIYGRYWTSTENGVSAFDRDVYSSKVGVYRGTFSKAYRYSVRYILKETIQYMQDFVPNPADTIGTEAMLTDRRDGIVYRCIKMADGRWWMGENLRGRFGSFVEGQPTETFGLLYGWASYEDYIPKGWCLPTNAEWTVLMDALGGWNAGCKMRSTTGWENFNGFNGNGTNSSGWNGLPGGYYTIFGNKYGNKGFWGCWWSTENFNYWGLYYGGEGIHGPDSWDDNARFSVRCILNQ